MRTAICVVLSSVLVLSVVQAGSAKKGKVEGTPVMVRPAANVLTQYLDRANIHPPVRLGRLTVFPISISQTNRLRNVLTMQQALEKKVLVIEELPSAQVPQAKFINKGNKMIFLMAGEVITGGKQNRTLTTDALLGPDSVTVLPVYCVQRGRWAGKKKFSAGAIAPQGVRARAAQKAGQSEVWAEVARANKRMKSADASGDLAVAMAKPENVKRLAGFRGRIVPNLPKNCAGIVVAYDGRIIGADLFNSAELFAAMRGKVLNAYLSQYGPTEPAPRVKGGRTVARPGQNDVRKYLRACYTARFTQAEKRGVGWIYNIRGSRFGQTLGYEIVLRHWKPTVKRPRPHPPREFLKQYMVHTSLMQKIVPVRSKVAPRPRRHEGRR